MVSPRRDAVGLVDSSRLVSRLVLAVEILQSAGEAVGDAVLVVQSDSVLNGFVADHVAVREILGENARTRLIFLFYFTLAGPSLPRALAFFAASGASEFRYAGRRGNLDLRRAELGVVKEESGFGGAICTLSVGEAFGKLTEELTSLSQT